MLKKCFLLLLLLSSLNVFAQTISRSQMDSIALVLSNQKRDSVRPYVKQIRQKLEILPREKTIPLFEYLIRRTEGSYTRMILCGEYAGYLVSYDEPEKSIAYCKMGLKLSKSLGETYDEMWFHISLGNAYIFQNRADEALFHLNIAEELAETTKTRDARISVNYSKGMVYESIEDFKSATRKYLLAWDLIDSSDHPEKGFYLYVLVDYFKRTGATAQQTRFTELLTEYYQERQPEAPMSHLPMNHIFDTTATEANINGYKKVIRVSDSMRALNTLIYSSFVLSDILLNEKRNEEAIQTLLPLSESLDTTDRDQQKMTLYGKLSSVYEATNDFKNALRYKNLEAELRDTLVSEKTKKNIAELEVKYDLQTKQRELEKEAASKKLLYWILGSVFVVLGILSFFFLKNRTKNRKLAKQKKLLEETVDEKNFLLKETHHRVKNSFQIVSSLLYLQSEHMSDTEAQRAIKEAQNRVRSMVLIHQKLYNKDQLVGIDAKEYFTDLTREIFGSHQMQDQQIYYSMDVESLVLDIESITPIGLILNELITNVLKHAFEPNETDKALNIEFHKPDDNLVLKVSDNGKGMPMEVQESSFGIKLMKALAKKIKATLTFENAPDRGTIATLEVSRYKIV